MKISIIGYGRMGQAIEQMAKDRGHEVGYINNGETIDLEAVKATDVAIEFTQPDAALRTITSILGTGTPVISGTTGWLDQKRIADEAAEANNTAFLYASNFSLGVNLFFVINEKLSALMKDHKMYTPSVHEIHHTGKKDAPSGTAITTAEGIIQAYPELKKWSQTKEEGALQITDDRIDPYCGTHTVTYESSIDKLSLEHHAHTRQGFAQGALIAAEWIQGKTGVFGMRDVLGL
jgi:4-hydroxy-tetrahydrodipicolinate reductase